MDKIVLPQERVFLVFFEDKGYYAAKQSNNDWSYTDDHMEAKHYKTKKGAMNVIKQASETQEYSELIGYIHPIKIKKTIEFDFEMMEKISNFVKQEPKHEVKIVDSDYSVKVVESSEDDPFWND